MIRRHAMTFALASIALGSSSVGVFATMPLLTAKPVPATSSTCAQWAEEQDEDALYMWGQQEDGISSNDIAKLRLRLHCLGEDIPAIVTFGSSVGASHAFCSTHATYLIC